MAIKISGILKDGMGKPIPNCTIELKSKKTSSTVIVETEAREGLKNTGSYSLSVEPGKYSVSLYVLGFQPKRVGEINVYSDSRPGTLNDFLIMPGESDLTPELVLIFQQLRDEARQAANEAKADKEQADNILTDVITAQTDVSEKQQQVNADMIEAGKSKVVATDSAKAASEDAGKTAADVAAVAGLKVNAEAAAQQAELSNASADSNAGRAETAANSVHTLTASASTLAPEVNATAHWDRETNNLSIGVPKGVKGDKGDKGEQGIRGIQGLQGIQGIKGDKGNTGPQAQLSPLLTAISALDTAANQLIYLTGKDATATTVLTELGRKLIAVTTSEAARQEIGAADDAKVLKIENNLSDLSNTGEALKNLKLDVELASKVSIGLNGTFPTYGRVIPGSNFNNALIGWCYVAGVYSNAPYAGVIYGSVFTFLDQGTLNYTSPPENGVNGQWWHQILFTTSGRMFKRSRINKGSGVNGGWGQWYEIYSSAIMTVDANGFVKKASPIVKLFGSGSSELNEESAGVTTERLSEGVYRLSGSLMGFNSDGAWDIEVPADDNKQPLIWVKSKVEASGDIIVNTYHRTHLSALKFAQNIIEGYNDGDPIDIPAGRWVDLRVQVYADDVEVVPDATDL